MTYQYRWIYAACCALLVIAGGYWMDLQSLLSERVRLASTIKDAELQAAVLQPTAMKKQKAALVNESTDFSALSRLLQRYHLMMESELVDAEDSEVDHTRQIKLSGAYSDLRRLIAVLAACDACEVGAVMLMPASQQRVQAAMNLTLPKHFQLTNLPESSEQMMNPFCGAETVIAERQPFIEAIHLLGIVTRNHEQRAIVKFPDGIINEVVVGDVLGSEGGRVEKVDDTKLIILFPDHTRKELH